MAATWTSRPIFISSTFKDMHAERDWLQHHVFPRIEEDLGQRRVHLEPIDLRLGVETGEAGSEEAWELLVLKVCLDEIQRSRPFLLVFLGDRYGWVPPADRMQTAAREQGFDTTVTQKSVTALEIEFGLFNQDPEQKARSLFFFRNPLPYHKMPPETAADYSDAHSPDPAVRVGHDKLLALKERLRNAPGTCARVFDYEAVWDSKAQRVTGLQAFGELVHAKLWAELDETTAQQVQQAPATWQDQERAGLIEFCEHRSRNFVGRKQLINQLLDLTTSDTSRGACIIGLPGAGKSALFARLYHAVNAKNDMVLLANAAGGTPRGSQVDGILLRWIEELANHLEISNPLPENPTQDDLDNTFFSLLHRAAAQQRIVLLLDALDQFEATNRGQHLTWLKSKQWPANAKLIATSLDSDPARALCQWEDTQTIDLPLLTAANAAEIGRQVWQRYHRQLSPQVLQVLIDKRLPDNTPACGNPLWLTLALEQLNLLDADDFTRAETDYSGTPTERMHALLLDTAAQMPPDIPGLYRWLLARNEKAFGKALTQAFAVAVALSRLGWREQDLFDLIPRLTTILVPDTPPSELDELTLATLRRGFRAHMLLRGALGQLDFYHLQMRSAVHQAYLQDPAQLRSLHSAISDYLESIDANDPLIRIERMRHLIGEGNALRAARYYAGLEVGQDTPFEERLGSSWTLVEWIASGEPESKVKDDESTNLNLQWIVKWLEQDELPNDECYRLSCNFMYGLLEKLENTVGLKPRRTLIEHTRTALQRLADADPSNAGWQRDLSVSHNKVGDVLLNQGDLSGALNAYRQYMAIAQRLADTDPSNTGWQSDLSVSHNKVGDVLLNQGDLSGALNAYRQCMAIAQRLADADPSNAGWQRDLSVSHNKVGDVLLNQGDLSGALNAYRQYMAIAQRLADADPSNTGWQRDLWVSFWKIADLCEKDQSLEATGWWHKAYTQLSAMKERGLYISQQDEKVLDQLRQKVGSSTPSQVSDLDSQARAHFHEGNYLEALRLFEQHLDNCRGSGAANSTQMAMNNVGCALQELGEWDRAMAMHKEQEAISRQNNLPYGIALSLQNQVEILLRCSEGQNLTAALPLAREAWALFAGLDMQDMVRHVEDFILRYDPDVAFVADGDVADSPSGSIVDLSAYRRKKKDA